MEELGTLNLSAKRAEGGRQEENPCQKKLLEIQSVLIRPFSAMPGITALLLPFCPESPNRDEPSG